MLLVYAGIFCTTLATLLLELALTRLFSVIFAYHYAFLAISIALFGLGVGGVLSYVVSDQARSLYNRVGTAGVTAALAVIGALAVILLQRDELGTLELLALYLATAVPFVLAGMVISAVIAATVERVSRVYFFDLAGAALGCLLLIPLLDWTGGPGTVVIAGAIFAVAGAIWFAIAGSRTGVAGSALLAIALVGAVAVDQQGELLRLRQARGINLGRPLFQRWNSFSRIAIIREGNRWTIDIDTDATTPIFDRDLSALTDGERTQLFAHGPALPYRLRPGARTLIIGPGGGYDVATALANGATHVTGVEINPIIGTDIMRSELSQMSKGLYLRPDVTIEIEDGRSFVRRSAGTYDVIQATLVDTWASTAAGAFALTENNLYTTDAFRDYLGHLSPTGIVAMSRWSFTPPRESLRVVSLAMAALADLGIQQPWRNVLVAREGPDENGLDTILVSRSPFTAEDVRRTREALVVAEMSPIYLPGELIPNEFTALLTSRDPAQYQRDYQFDITPVTDNRPFFFYTVQPRDLLAFVTSGNRTDLDFKINEAVPILLGAAAVAIIATVLLIALPPLLLGTRLPQAPGVRSFLAYFVLIGTGYILIEVALIQKFVLFLGHPTYALTCVIFSMLLATGLGSAAQPRLVGASNERLTLALAIVAGLTAALAVTATPLLTSLLALPLAAKMAVTVALVAPPAFLMGLPFPSALQLLGRWHAPSLRWAWSLNAASSVLGSVGALVLAIYIGLTQTLLVGSGLYLLALVVLKRSRQPNYS